MSEKNSGIIIHPEIISLIQKRDEIHRLLYVDYSPIPAIEQMIGILNEIRREDVDAELHETLNKSRLRITTTRSRTRRLQKGKDMKWKLWGYLMKINHILTDKGYLTNDFYSTFYDPTKGRKSGG